MISKDYAHVLVWTGLLNIQTQTNVELMKTDGTVADEMTKTNKNIRTDDAEWRKLPTDSFQSATHFSIHGTMLITTNSRVKRPMFWISPSHR